MRMTTIACAVKMRYPVPTAAETPILIGPSRVFVQGRAAGKGFSNNLAYDVDIPKFVSAVVDQTMQKVDRAMLNVGCAARIAAKDVAKMAAICDELKTHKEYYK
ncbi:hypothetical protein [Vibrio phage VP06]|nr:hypothetical protein [Vibrio phage VP06]